MKSPNWSRVRAEAVAGVQALAAISFALARFWQVHNGVQPVKCSLAEDLPLLSTAGLQGGSPSSFLILLIYGDGWVRIRLMGCISLPSVDSRSKARRDRGSVC
ncbi:uncharacterized protein LOC121758375 isoform X2 [Salvia splendens]|uniref:uncharacterized protein LOC121758375 isoform X2 n=1 Tax=Salvia splendens TaxID=180675 RepID=UPI001C263524|nr:uncharacterized protein LOC121758375 isoform X2 [Salvia splendens]